MQQQSLGNQIEQLLHQLNNGQQGADDQQQPEEEEPEVIDVYFVRRETGPPEDLIIDATPQNKPSQLFTAATVLFCLMLLISAILFQLYLIFHPPIATVTIIPKAQTVTLTGTLQAGRLLHPITLSQSQTVPATGKGHQDAARAAGTLTFYNGQVQTITIPSGTVLTGADGEQIATDQDAAIPAESQTIPPSLGQVTVSAHALIPGAKGNIPTGDINKSCCFSSVLVQNTAAFYGGQDERNFQIVTKHDIEIAASPMKTTLTQSMQGALQGQLQPQEQLSLLPCMPTVTNDHQAGEEATRVTVTVSQTCSGIAYNSEELKAKATELLTSQAMKKLGAGYSLFGDIHVTTSQATVTHAKPTLTFSSVGTWVYGLPGIAQEHMKSLVAGKTIQQARNILATFPGIKNVNLQWDQQAKLPKDTRLIKFLVLINI